MAARLKKGIDWDYYGVDILKYDYLPSKGGTKTNRDNYIDTNGLRRELQKEGINENEVRKRFMGVE